MANRTLNPTSAGRRGQTVPDFKELTVSRPEPSLTTGRARKSGRNNKGRITSRWQGGGHKQRYRIIDFKRNKFDVPAKVASIEYDPNRKARIALLFYADGEKRYILAPKGLRPGAEVVSGDQADITPGNSLPFSRIPPGTYVHNLELFPGKGGQLCRSAGTYAQLLDKEGKYVLIRLPSGETRKVLGTCRATVGQVGNLEHESLRIGKAGRNRQLNTRPKVRGVAMNPVDHPLGGGEGRSSGGRHPVTPWGLPTKGYKTRRKNKPSSKLIVKKRQRK